MSLTKKIETAVFGGGCFWCTEAVFNELRGVISVMPGYSGGNPPVGRDRLTYEDVSSGQTGHAEVTKIEFDPSQIAYKNLLTVFFATHDPTTVNRQCNDIGTQYRSIIFYTNDGQKKEAEAMVKEMNKTGPKTTPVVTELKPFEKFYEAEDYHKQYYQNNPDKPYCQIVINPKLKKVKEQFAASFKKKAS